MLSDKKFTYYQPQAYYDDGTNINYGSLPEELFSFQAFPTREECEAWLQNNRYEPGDFCINEYQDDDIEEVTLIDQYGDVIETKNENSMKRENYITENLALGLLDTEKKLVYGVLNTANYDVMGYAFIAGDTPDCLENVGCFPEDIEKADKLEVGDMLYAEWLADRAVLIVKMKDDRLTS